MPEQDQTIGSRDTQQGNWQICGERDNAGQRRTQSVGFANQGGGLREIRGLPSYKGVENKGGGRGRPEESGPRSGKPVSVVLKQLGRMRTGRMDCGVPVRWLLGSGEGNREFGARGKLAPAPGASLIR